MMDKLRKSKTAKGLASIIAPLMLASGIYFSNPRHSHANQTYEDTTKGLTQIKTGPVKTSPLDQKITKFIELYEAHKIRNFRHSKASEIPKDVIEKEVNIHGKNVKIRIPGFESLSCNKCHSANELTDSMSNKIKKSLDLIKEHYDETLDAKSLIPEEVNMLPFLDDDTTLSEYVLAEGHVSSKRISIHALILLFEKLFLNDSTTAHEMIHMSQTIGNYLLEQDTYFVNATQNTAYAAGNIYIKDYKDIITNFFDPTILKSFEEVKKIPPDKKVEEYTKKHYCFKFLKKINPETDEKIKQSIKQLKPLFIEALKERRAHSLEWNFLFRAYSEENIGLDVIAAKNYKPVSKIYPKRLEEGLEILSAIKIQDSLNKPLGDFREGLSFGMGFKSTSKRLLEEKGFSYEEFLHVYFTYLKKEYVTEEGKINYEKIWGGIKENPKFIDEIIYTLERFLGLPGLTKSGEKRTNDELQKLRKLLPEDYDRSGTYFGRLPGEV